MGPGRTRQSLLLTGKARGEWAATGTAPVDHPTVGGCAVTTGRVGTWENDSPGLAGRIDAGTTGQVLDAGTTADGEDRVLSSPDRTLPPAGWVDWLALERC